MARFSDLIMLMFCIYSITRHVCHLPFL